MVLDRQRSYDYDSRLVSLGLSHSCWQTGAGHMIDCINDLDIEILVFTLLILRRMSDY